MLGNMLDSEQVCPLENLILHWKKLMLTKQPLITTKWYHNVRGAKTKIRMKFCGSTEQGKISSALAEVEAHTWESWGEEDTFVLGLKEWVEITVYQWDYDTDIPGTENSICKGFNMKVHGTISEH